MNRKSKLRQSEKATKWKIPFSIGIVVLLIIVAYIVINYGNNAPHKQSPEQAIGDFVLVSNTPLKQNGKIVVFFIVVIVVGAFLVGVMHSYEKESKTVHQGVHIVIEKAEFVNSSGSYDFTTVVKNTGTLFIDTVTITVTETGSTLGVIPSIQAGSAANGSFPVSGVTNGTLYVLEYLAVSGNVSYETSYPVMG